ncbi:adhesion G-protein coupled receptor G2-like [Cheilinus undulatus]|uniref:adhesion G-protein coupled receptor G2-like n=1 Tax=Cheilinus undulatus TaxID=241271 RepID=UPI001BD47318|nr:adhesion G-protein coupled receptor G2-like [Cheilinus undulatus]
MIPLLLLMLLPLSLAIQDKVCFNITDGNIQVNSTYLHIFDGRWAPNCSLNGSCCLLRCMSRVSQWFNGSRECFDANVTIHPTMHEYKLTQDINCTAYLCDGTVILRMMDDLNSETAMHYEMMELYYIRQSCAHLFKHNPEVMIHFIKIEKEIIHNIMRDSQLETGGSKTHNFKTLSLNVISINESDLSLAGTDSRIRVQAPQLLPQNESFIPNIWLPVNAMRDIPQEKRVIGLACYSDPSQFQFKNDTISSVVVRIELLGDRQLHDLNTSIKMIFRTTTPNNADDRQLLCKYFSETDFSWESDGCETYNETYEHHTDITCFCDHTTPFAVLLMKEPISKAHWEILSYISYIGCGLSAFFTALSLVIYVFSRNHKLDYSISIHVSLSGALLLLNTAFLLTEWGATTEPDWVCVFVAAVMHYSLLCCFTWMAIEALHLYLLLIKVFNTYYKHYLLKLSLAGWGIPGVIVGISLGLKDFKQFYGVSHMTMSDTNQTNAICWITDDSFFYSINLVYFTLIFVFNSGILVAVASSICRMKQVVRTRTSLRAGTMAEKTWNDPQRLSDSCRGGLTVLGLTCLMGTTWGLAFLGSGYVNYPILYLFCILNSAQGFFIFLWICLSAKKQRKREMEERLSSTPVKSSGIKSE